jgi:hypothetical protein
MIASQPFLLSLDLTAIAMAQRYLRRLLSSLYLDWLPAWGRREVLCDSKLKPLENRSGSIVIAVFVVVAAGLLFVPEITRLMGGGNKPPIVVDSDENSKNEKAKKNVKDEESAVTKNEQGYGEPPEEDGEVPEAESFAKVIDQIEEGDVELSPLASENQKNTKVVPSKQIPEVTIEEENDPQVEKKADDTELPVDDLAEPPIPAARKAEREELRKALLDDKVNWKVLQNPKVLKPLEGAVKDGTKLLKILGQEYPRSRFALLNYITALSGLLKKNVPGTDFKEMLQYIGVLDVRVTQSFIEERISRTEYLLWRAISVGPFVEMAGGRNDFGYDPPFKGDVILTELAVTVAITRRNARVFHLRVAGVIEGKEARRIEVYKGKEVIKAIELPMPSIRNGKVNYRKFGFGYTDTSGSQLYTFRVLDERGYKFQKTYSLVAAAMSKFPTGRNGALIIPAVRNSRPFDRPSLILDDILVLEKENSSSSIPTGTGSKVSPDGELMNFSNLNQKTGKVKRF